MKLAVTATGKDLASSSDGRFGRCSYFVLIDPETMDYEALENPGKGARGGAGVQAAQALANSGVDALATGNVGPNAFNTLDSAGIEMYTGASGTVREVVEAYKDGKLSQTNGPTAAGGAGK